MSTAFERTASVPDVSSIPTLAELEADLRNLARQHPDSARFSEIGTSRDGHPIVCLTVGDGDADAVVYGGPHANELIGSLTVQWLARALVTDDGLRRSTGYRWHLVPTIDPDAYRLNEGWVGDPSSIRSYHRSFYRPAATEYVDWSFPLRYQDLEFDCALPETEVLRRLLDDTRPAFCYSLHNAEFGGAFFLLRGEVGSEAAAALSQLPGEIGVPLEEGSIEMLVGEVLAPAVFQMDTVSSLYDQLVEAGHPDPAGAWPLGEHAGHYAEREHGTVTLVAELPYWQDARAGDRSPADQTLGEVAQTCCALIESGLDELRAGLAALDVADPTRSDSPHLRAVADMVPMFSRLAAQQQASILGTPAEHEPATVADSFSRGDAMRSMLQRGRGMLLHHLQAVPDPSERVRTATAQLQAGFDAAAGALEAMDAHPISLRDLVRVQAAAGLLVADHVRERRSA